MEVIRKVSSDTVNNLFSKSVDCGQANPRVKIVTMMNAKLPQSEETFLPTQTLAGNTTGRVLKPAAFVDPF